jgi:uncharacterized protein YecA (UPF0149 family)
VREDLRRVHEQGLIDGFYIRWEDIEGALGVGKEAAMKALKERYRLIDDAEKEMSWWACFEENKHRKVKLGWDTPIRKAPKVGRNEPCPCGSGKKFKKCCGR